MADFLVKPLEAGLDFDHLRYWDVVIVQIGFLSAKDTFERQASSPSATSTATSS